MTIAASFTPKPAILSFAITHELLTMRLFLDSLANNNFRMKKYLSPSVAIVELESSSIICASNQQVRSNSNSVGSSLTNVYSSMSYNQKLAAMNLMIVFGGSCSGTPQELNKINHIMTVEGKEMGLSGEEVHAGAAKFDGMKDMVNAIKGVNRNALEKLFWAYYCIIAAGKSAEAVQVLLGVYKDLEFTEEECVSILERITGRKIN